MYAKPLSERFIDELSALYAARGDSWYGGEAVTQLEHALQCAALAEADGASDELITASLLHDLGHITQDAPHADVSLDGRHEYRALHKLRRHFGDAVLSPIRLHVAAKRYLCGVKPSYYQALSAESRRSLKLQGGSYTQAQAQAFIGQPYARDAVRLRLWDDRAKEPGKMTPGFGHYIDILLRCAQ